MYFVAKDFLTDKILPENCKVWKLDIWMWNKYKMVTVWIYK